MKSLMKKTFFLLMATLSVNIAASANLTRKLGILTGSLKDLTYVLQHSTNYSDYSAPLVKFGSFHKKIVAFFDKYDEERGSLRRDTDGHFINKNAPTDLQNQLNNNIINFFKAKRLSYKKNNNEESIKKLVDYYVKGIYDPQEKQRYLRTMSQQNYKDLIVCEIVDLFELCSKDTFNDCLVALLTDKIVDCFKKNQDLFNRAVDKLKQLDEIKNNSHNQHLLQSYRESMLLLEKNESSGNSLSQEKNDRFGFHIIMKDFAPLYNAIKYSENNCRVIKMVTDFVNDDGKKEKSKQDNIKKQQDKSKVKAEQKKQLTSIESLLNSTKFSFEVKNGQIKNIESFNDFMTKNGVNINDMLQHEIAKKVNAKNNSLYNMINYLLQYIKNPSMQWNANRGIDRVNSIAQLNHIIAKKITDFDYNTSTDDQQNDDQYIDDQKGNLKNNETIANRQNIDSDVENALRKAIHKYSNIRQKGLYTNNLENIIEDELSASLRYNKQSLNITLKNHFWNQKVSGSNLTYSQELSTLSRKNNDQSHKAIYNMLIKPLNEFLNSDNSFEEMGQISQERLNHLRHQLNEGYKTIDRQTDTAQHPKDSEHSDRPSTNNRNNQANVIHPDLPDIVEDEPNKTPTKPIIDTEDSDTEDSDTEDSDTEDSDTEKSDTEESEPFNFLGKVKYDKGDLNSKVLYSTIQLIITSSSPDLINKVMSHLKNGLAIMIYEEEEGSFKSPKNLESLRYEFIHLIRDEAFTKENYKYNPQLLFNSLLEKMKLLKY